MAAVLNADVKKNIQDATARLLHAKAFAGITLGDIAEKAGISKGTLYYYYKSKDDILFDIADAYLNMLANDLISWTENKAKDTSLPRLLNYVITRGVNNESGNLRLYLIGAAVGKDDILRKRIVEKYQYFKETLSQKLYERTENKDCDYMAWLILTVMDGLLVQNQLANDDFNSDDFVKKTVAMLSQN
ncbi:MAG: TetR/AcrR family transcriptional regulator [Oscillospiraceae bacterium]